MQNNLKKSFPFKIVKNTFFLTNKRYILNFFFENLNDLMQNNLKKSFPSKIVKNTFFLTNWNKRYILNFFFFFFFFKSNFEPISILEKERC